MSGRRPPIVAGLFVQIEQVYNAVGPLVAALGTFGRSLLGRGSERYDAGARHVDIVSRVENRSGQTVDSSGEGADLDYRDQFSTDNV